MFLLDYILPARIKYSCHGTCHFPNVMENIEQNVFPTLPLSSSIAGCNTWLFTLVPSVEDGETYIYPHIFLDRCPRFGVHYLFEIKTKSSYKYEGKCITDEDEGVYGRGIKVTDLENGYLKNGELSIDYGIKVESVEVNQIWIFNLQDPFCADTPAFEITFGSDKVLYSHKQPLVFHSRCFQTESSNIKPSKVLFLVRNFNKCIQIAHGVRYKGCDAKTLFAIIPIAQSYHLRNVVRYCEQELIETCPFDRSMAEEWITEAIRFNLRHLLAKILRETDTFEDVMGVLKTMNGKKMSREMMKMCIHFFIELD